MTTHYLPRRLDPACGADAEAMFAVQPGGGAFVFIHGFNGRASGTWHDFPGMLPGRPACASADAYFFGYDSLRTPATVSAAILRAFLQRVWAQPVALANTVLDAAAHRPADYRYTSLTLVAHSLGSVVARQAMVNGLWNTPPDEWTCRARLVLFAPAHKGAKVQALAMECLSGLGWIGSVFGALAKQRFQTLNDLEPGSATLQQLEQRVLALEARGVVSARANRVVWAEKDTVVNQLDFGSDPPAELVRGKGHVDVCKPDRSYLRPIEILEAPV